MSPAFWDTSALVPLCVRQQPGPVVQDLLKEHSIVVWWATPVEMRSVFERLLRMNQLSAAEYATAEARLDQLRVSWRELQPSEPLRAQAELLLTTYSLKTADALQLAAAWVWSSGAPRSFSFISADCQLVQAARQLGFQVVVPA